jgi:putative ABC transport system permease protein
MEGNERKKKIPAIILWLISKQKKYNENYSSCEDFIEFYNYIYQTQNWLMATFLVWINILVMILVNLRSTISGSYFMFKKHLKFILRNTNRNKTYTFINVAGLAVGMACTIFIMLWVQDEISYNQFHKNIDNIYWLTEWVSHNGVASSLQGSVTAIGPSLKKEYPEIINFTRNVNGNLRFLIHYRKKSFFEKVRLGDFSIFRIFTFPILKGNPELHEGNPNVIMLSQKMAKKYFGSENPVGKILTLDNRYDLKIVGVYKEITRQSTINFDLIVPLEFGDKIFNRNCSFNWNDDGHQTYLHLKDGIDFTAFNTKIKDFYKKYNKDNRWPVIYPFKKFHMEEWGWGKKNMVRIFLIVAFLILIVACFNFMNLATARSVKRAKEVGLKKVIGAKRGQLIVQFLCESTVFSLLAMLIALLLVCSSLPWFSEITGKPLTIENIFSLNIVLVIAVIAILTGLLSGIYPAFYLSSFSPGVVLKGSDRVSLKKSTLRKVSVVGQFTISIILIICSLLIFKQITYLKNADWGFDRDNIVYFQLEGKLKHDHEGLKNELLAKPGVVNVTATSHTPGGVWAGNSGWVWEGKDPEFHLWSRVFIADSNFLKTFNMKMVEGHFFQKGSNLRNQIVINEKFAQIMNLKNPVGKYIREESINNNVPSKIIGIIEDYHIAPFNSKINPLIIFPNFKWGNNVVNYSYMFIKLNPKNILDSLTFVKECIKEHNPEYPFKCLFYDTYFKKLYRKEKMVGNVVRLFTILAIFISCLGLFGLSSFTSEQRCTEIGIRKVLGASTSSIIYLLSKQFIKWVVISYIIAIPIAFYFIQRWLNGFAYKFDLGLWLFLIPGIFALLIAIATISFQSIKAALANPVDSIKYE